MPCSHMRLRFAIVTPPAVSVNTPSVSASSVMPSRISSSVHHSMCPPVLRATCIANIPSAGDPIARERSIVLGFIGVTVSAPSWNACATGRHPSGCAPDTRYGFAASGPRLVRLLEPPGNLGEQRAARDRHDAGVGQAPAELLRGLEPERFRPLGVERPHVHI